MTALFIRISLLCLLCCLLGAETVEPTTGLRPGKDHALFFAVNTYAYMDNLNRPIQNAREIAAELKTNYGFQTEVIENPSIDQIDAKIDAYRKRYANGTYPADGQLLIYFSGHGVKAGANGYFMASDSDPQRPNRNGLEYDFYRSKIDEINCKHILVAIDACHSATFDPAFGMRNNRTFRRKGEEQFDRILANHDSYKARCFWTSDGVGEQTPDRSNFAYQFLEGLRGHHSTTGYLRSSELFSVYLEKAAPKPGGGRFGQDEPSACFLFFQEVSDLSSLQADANAWKRADQSNTIPAYRNYLRNFPNGDFATVARQRIDTLETQDAELADLRDWQLAKQSNTQAAYQRYLTGHPKGQFRVAAEAALAGFSPTDLLPRPKMIRIPGGTFQMGSNEGEEDEKPIHSVTVSDFELGETEVTVAEFKAFVDAANYRTDAEKEGYSWKYTSEWEKMEGINWRHDEAGKIRPVTDHNHPVIHVSWNDAQAYCKWLSKQGLGVYRLPTEAEWEYAAGNGTKHTRYSWGNGGPSGKNGGNVADETGKKKHSGWTIFEGFDDGFAGTASVKSFYANDYALYDMTGNVWEWCGDWYGSDYYASSPGRNPTGPDSGAHRVVRGGSWFNYPSYCRVANRNYYSPTYRDNYVGFRVARQF